MKKTSPDFDVIIIGGGLSGMTLSVLLGQAGISTICLDAAAPQTLNKDLRTTAISYGSAKILSSGRIWQDMLKSGKACPIEDIKIYDGDSPLLLQFLSSEVENNAFGWIVENADLRDVLTTKIKSLKTIEHRAPVKAIDFTVETNIAAAFLENGERITASLIIGADGRQSHLRQWMDIGTRQWNYHQRAVICAVTHENPHNNIAIEHFWPEGPFAVLPMHDDENGNHRSSVVFTEHGSPRDSLMHYNDADFETALNARFPKNYGAVKMVTKRASYPLNLIHAQRYIGNRMALIADAAHGIHPIAGQGLNLGFRDVGKIAELLIDAHNYGQDLGSPDLLETYQRARRFDNMTMVAVTDGLVRLFSNNLPPVRFLRRTGLKLVSKIAPAKQFFMRGAMGDR